VYVCVCVCVCACGVEEVVELSVYVCVCVCLCVCVCSVCVYVDGWWSTPLVSGVCVCVCMCVCGVEEFVLPGIIGLLQAGEVIKLICEIGDPLKGRLLYFDALKMKFKELKLRKDPNCTLCGPNPTVTQLIDYQQFCGIPQAKAKEAEMEDDIQQMTVQELQKRLADPNDNLMLIDVRESEEYEICNIKGSVLRPLSTLETNFDDLPKDKDLIIHCKMGGRSQRACEFLKEKGYQNLANVAGGITAWAEEVDQEMPTY